MPVFLSALLLLLTSCSTDIDVPSSLSYPSWLEGTWTTTGIEVTASQGDIVITLDDYDEKRSVLDELKDWEDSLTYFNEEKDSTSYSLEFTTLVYGPDKDDDDDDTETSTEISFTYSSSTKVKFTLKGNWPVSYEDTVSYSSKTLTASD